MGQLSATMQVMEQKISVEQHNIWFKKKKSQMSWNRVLLDFT